MASLVLALAAPRVAAAQEAERVAVTLEVEPCAGIEPDVVRRIVELELSPRVDLESTSTDASVLRSDCEAEQVVLTLDERLTGKRLERTVDLTGAAGSRSRLVALALVELLTASWIELGMRREPEIPVIGARDDPNAARAALDVAQERMPPAPPSAPTALPPLGLHAFGLVRVSGDPLHFAGGGGLGVDYELAAPLVLIGDLRAEQGSVSVTDFGYVRATAAWATALLALRHPLELGYFDFAAGARVGVGVLEGSSQSDAIGRTVSGVLAALVGAAHVALHVENALYVNVGIEVAWVVLPIYGTATDGTSLVRLDGGQMLLTLGFVVRP